jgi:hypothetical protein
VYQSHTGRPDWALVPAKLAQRLNTTTNNNNNNNTHSNARNVTVLPRSFRFLRWVHACNFTAYRNVVTLQVTDTIRSYDLNFHPVPHGVTVSCERHTMGFPVCYGSQKARGADDDVSRCTSGRNRITRLMRRPNTDSAPNMSVTLPRNQLLIRYVVTSPVHTFTIRCYGMR